MVKLALLAYPRSIRVLRGEEMIGTALDAGAASVSALAYETGALIVGGIRCRASTVADPAVRRVISDFACYAAMVWILFTLMGQDGLVSRTAYPLEAILLGGSFVLVLGGLGRAAGAAGLVWVVFAELFSVSLRGPLLSVVLPLAEILAPLAFFTVMTCARRSRRADPRRLLWLIAPAVLLLLNVTPGERQQLVIVGAVAAGAVLLLPLDLRLAIGVTATWLGIGAWSVATGLTLSYQWIHNPILWCVAAAPVVVAIGLASRRRLLRS